MIYLFDTSFLVAFFEPTHPEHVNTVNYYEALNPDDNLFISAHSIAEFYNTMTKPNLYDYDPNEVNELIEQQLLKTFSTVSLHKAYYVQATQLCGSRNMSGGIIYDAMIVVCAQRIGADRIVSFNNRHFRIFLPGNQLVTP